MSRPVWQSLGIVALLALAFIAGMHVQSLRPSSSSAPTEPAGSPPAGSNRSAVTQAESQRSPAPSARGARSGNRQGEATLSISPAVLDALLAGGGEEKMLKGMELTEDQIEAILNLQQQAMESFRALEVKHAREVSDEKGDYVRVAAFPVERSEWLETALADLRSIVTDDRAEILARVLSFSDNDAQAGKFMREIFARVQEDGRILIEERSFDDAGRLFDSDFEEVRPDTAQLRGSWEHLLDFPWADRVP